MQLKRENLQTPQIKSNNTNASQTEFDRLKRNSVLFFQVGLIMVLLAVYILLEMQFETKPLEIAYKTVPIDEPKTVLMTNFIIEKPKTEKPIVKKAKPVVKHSDKIKVVKNTTEIKQLGKKLFPVKEQPPVNPKPIDVNTLNVEKPEPPVSIIAVESVPIFPGCEQQTTREGKIKCMSTKMSKFIQKKFNTNLAVQTGLTGKQRIHVMFKIDEKGVITNLKARAPHNKLELEAKRVVAKLPKMIPGKQGNTPVSVMYYLPITFNIK